MEIKAHLNDQEFLEALSNPGRGVIAHLDMCDSCRTEVGRLRRTLSAEVLEAAPPEDFWAQQRVAIHQRMGELRESRSHRAPRLAWAALAATIVFGTLWMNDAEKPPAAPRPAQVDQDQELMIAVESAMQTDVPEALEPASLLAQEMTKENGTQPNSQPHARGTVDEN